MSDHKPDSYDVTDFRFRDSNTHNRDMLEYQAEKAFMAGKPELAAQFAIAGALHGLLDIIAGHETASLTEALWPIAERKEPGKLDWLAREMGGNP